MTERVVYGVGPVSELLQRRARDIAVLYVRGIRKARDRDPVAELVRVARSRGVSIEESGRDALDALAGGRQHQGVVAISGEYVYGDMDDVLAGQGDRPALWLALDGVSDPHNLGAIVRSAHLLGVDGVLVPRDRAARVTATVTKVSAGATEHVAICQVTNMVRSLESLKEAGIWLAALSAGPGALALPDLDASAPLCLVLGSEGKGIRKLVARTCDHRVVIPMTVAGGGGAATGVDSFNVSVAAAIALYEVARQRR